MSPSKVHITQEQVAVGNKAYPVTSIKSVGVSTVRASLYPGAYRATASVAALGYMIWSVLYSTGYQQESHLYLLASISLLALVLTALIWYFTPHQEIYTVTLRLEDDSGPVSIVASTNRQSIQEVVDLIEGAVRGSEREEADVGISEVRVTDSLILIGERIYKRGEVRSVTLLSYWLSRSWAGLGLSLGTFTLLPAMKILSQTNTLPVQLHPIINLLWLLLGICLFWVLLTKHGKLVYALRLTNVAGATIVLATLDHNFANEAVAQLQGSTSSKGLREARDI